MCGTVSARIGANPRPSRDPARPVRDDRRISRGNPRPSRDGPRPGSNGLRPTRDGHRSVQRGARFVRTGVRPNPTGVRRSQPTLRPNPTDVRPEPFDVSPDPIDLGPTPTGVGPTLMGLPVLQQAGTARLRPCTRRVLDETLGGRGSPRSRRDSGATSKSSRPATAPSGGRCGAAHLRQLEPHRDPQLARQPRRIFLSDPGGQPGRQLLLAQDTEAQAPIEGRVPGNLPKRA